MFVVRQSDDKSHPIIQSQPIFDIIAQRVSRFFVIIVQLSDTKHSVTMEQMTFVSCSIVTLYVCLSIYNRSTLVYLPTASY